MKFEHVRVIEVEPDLLRRYRELAEMTGKIKFGCDVCERGVMRCCAGCLENIGYLRWVNKDDVKVYRSLFVDKEHDPKASEGFWTLSGCALPRKYRSMTCLTHRCWRLRGDEKKLAPWEEKICDDLIAFNTIISTGGVA